jgi:glycosyltransferase involved in cell wall biosynthesis
VYGTEYSLKTRRQIINAETGNPLLRARRHLWEWNQERRQRKAIRAATGVQCNGTPTFEAYRALNRNPLLFFDTRTTRDMVIRENDLRQRLAGLGSSRPLRLAFSGRLNRMKGAHYLPRIAERLRSLSVDFTMVICGDGDQVEFLRSELQRRQLADRVDLKGVLDFKTELVPLMQREADLFICPHVQGDPSCTYLETMASAVPIVGFGNEAWQGIVDREEVGEVVRVGDAEGLAQAVARLAAKPERIESLSWNARRMAEAHTFESTFKTRIEHLRACAHEAANTA